MLTIRTPQMAMFRELEVQKFEDWTLGHLKKFFPRECDGMGEQKVRETIGYGIQRAAYHKITAKRDVAKYIDLMVVFGRNFDTDRRTKWAGDILRQGGYSGTRMEALRRAAKLHLKRK